MINSHSKLSITVIIPTYLRPQYLLNCLNGLLKQTKLPDQIIVVMRDTDSASRQAFEVFTHNLNGAAICIRSAIVIEPGFLPPLVMGISQATGDIVAFLDDDAEPYPDWLERLASHYTDPSVGGVGGRSINMDGDNEIKYPVVKKVGRFLWFGRVIGNMYRDSIFETPIKVDFFMGGNMSYRRSLLENINIDLKLNNYVAANYEVDLGLQFKELGYTLVYDPMARIKHFSAPRSKEVLRVRSSEAIYWYSFNLQYITLKHSKGWRRFVGSIYGITVGDRGSWGLVAVLVYTLKHHRFDWVKEIKPAFAGKLHAIRRYISKTATT